MRFGLLPLAATAMLATMAAAPAFADTLVVPGTAAGADANGANAYPFFTSNSLRFQQVFNASAFSSLTGPVLITGFDLRNDAGYDRPFSYSMPSIDISLSTTGKAADGLSATFADNIGTNATQVFQGPLTLSSAGGTSGAGGTPPFDISVAFSTSFLYDPAAGNLLLDVLKSGTSNSVSVFPDAQTISTDGISRVYSPFSGVAATGYTDSTGLVVRLHTTAAPAAIVTPTAAVPEPAAWAMMILGMGAVGFAMRRQKTGSRVFYAA